MKRLQQAFFSQADLTIEHREEDSLIALQGPKAAEVLQTFLKTDLRKVFFNNFIKEKIARFDAEFIINRTGYTGEDGFEISLPNAAAVPFTEALFATEHVYPAGLGARDALRLEAGNITRAVSSRARHFGGNIASRSPSPMDHSQKECFSKLLWL